ncbi:MAG: VOC family protein [Mucilaginibacter sp.]|nr:VOC family protein [Mucilaginibacter sp.]
MSQKISVITLGVEDLELQKTFYKNQLGWIPEAENKDIIFFKMNGFLFSLFNRKALADGAGVSADGSGFRALTLSMNVPTEHEVDEIFSLFKAKGIAIVKAPEKTPFGGYYFTFADPEKNVWEITYNPYIPLDDDGNVITHKSIDNL